MSVQDVARKWHDQFLRTDPIDHEQAEAAVRAAYRTAGMAEPEHFLWCSSPLEAVWSVLVLVGKTESYNHAVFDDVERSKSGRAGIEAARTRVAETLGIEEAQVEGYFGKPFYLAEGSNPVTKKLQENFDAWMARAEAGNDFLAIHKQGPFKPLHDLEQALHFEGERRGSGSLFKEALKAAANKSVAILGGRSALHRLYGNFAYSEIAVDEALTALGKLQPTELERAVWAAFEATGMWWPCHGGVVLAERPEAVELDCSNVGMRWADGFTVGEVSGEAQAKPEPLAVASDPASATSVAAILTRELPRDHQARIAELRKAASLPLFDRYLAGEHEQVWKELIALGEKVRSEAHAVDALAVAYETMHRVEQNVRTLAFRLRDLGYNFVYPGSSGGLFGLRKPKAHEPIVAPPADVTKKIAELEEQVAGPIPLSLRAFLEVVGEVNLNGDHPTIAPKDSDIAPDPLMVCDIEGALALTSEDYRDEDEDRISLDFAPDALHKANVSGGSPYSIRLPNGSADAPVEDAPHEVTFVEYLRIAFRWGGFPGWEGRANPPAELEQLRTGLIPF